MNSLKTKKELNGGTLAFIICFATAIIIFLPFVIVDKGLFLYCGDFNSQQIPFYYYANNFFKNTPGQWSWLTDLGGSMANSYSFYLLGSPFFWLSAMFPAAWVPFLMVPLFGVKFGVAGLGAYLYIKRYAKSRNFAVIGACLYAFSGFTVYNTFFNHFVDCIALFPFLLWALDEFVYEKRRGIFVLFVAINLINNYFFFAGEVVFLFIYFIAKVLTGDYKIRLSRFALLAFESLLGVGMGCLLLIPAVLSLRDNPRTIDMSNGFGLLLYDKVQQYFEILASLFFPPDPTYLPNMFTEGVIKWTSMSAFLPIVGCAGVVAYLRARKKSTFSKVLYTCLFMAFVPILNSAFYALNSSYYARWYFMPILIMCAATINALEDSDIDLLGGIKTVGIITAAFVVFGLVPTKTDDVWAIGVTEEPAKFWLTWLTAILMLFIFYCIVRWFRQSVRFAPLMLAAILGFSVFYSVIHVSLGKFPQWDNDKSYRAECYDAARKSALPEGFYRIDAYECYDNVGLWFNKPCLHFFNSTVTPSIMKFYPPVGVKRDVSSKPDADLYALHGLLSTKYMVSRLSKSAEFEEKYIQYGWKTAWSDDAFTYYENINYIPMGFTYDNYFEQETLDDTSEKMRSNLLVRAIGLSDEQIEKYDFLTKADKNMLSYSSYTEDADARRASAAYSFDATSHGFTAKINMPSENLVFFSVPYESGFTAKVNGIETDIENVSGGMCAVYAPSGNNEIVFTYKTPGLSVAFIITIISIAVFGAYIIIILISRKKAQIIKTKEELE
ncbi:MAG: YfhO family protein [Oscillospiraceae bacterium]